MAVASQVRSTGAIWSKKRTGEMEGGVGLRKDAKGGGAVVQAGGISTGSDKSGFSLGKLLRTLSCFHRPITADKDDAVPKFVTIGDGAEERGSPGSWNLKKSGLCDDVGFEVGAMDVADEFQARDGEEIFLSAREDVEGEL